MESREIPGTGLEDCQVSAMPTGMVVEWGFLTIWMIGNSFHE